MDEGFLLRDWDLDAGLKSTRISAVVRTPEGYVWVTTLNGVARFDGERFTIFDSSTVPGFKDGNVSALFVDRSGVLWIGTTEGRLLKHTDAGFTTVDLHGASRGSRLNALGQDARGALWIGTRDGDVIQFDCGQVKSFGSDEGWIRRNVSEFLTDSTGLLWALAGGKLLTFDQGRWVSPAAGSPPGVVQAIASASDGSLWAATSVRTTQDYRDARIYRLKKGYWKSELEPYPWPEDSRRSNIRALIEDKEGRVWCGTDGRGVFLWSPTEGWRALAAGKPLSKLETLCFAEDEGGVVWIGTRTAGLYQALPRPAKCCRLPAGYEESTVVAACVTEDGSVWGGTDSAGVFRWHGRETTHFNVEQEGVHVPITVLLEDRHTNLWAGTHNGLFRFEDGTFKPSSGSRLLRNATYSLMEDERGRIWAGMRNNVLCLEDGRTTDYGHAEGLPPGQVHALAEDHEGCVWVAVEDVGLCRLNGNRFERYEPEVWSNSRPVEDWPGKYVIRTLHWDAAGSLWIATRGYGLYRLKNGQLQQWQWNRDGLPSNHLLALEEDHGGNLWFSSENGIFGLSKQVLNGYRFGRDPVLRPWRLTPAEGLPLKVCTGVGQPAAARSADGRLWFPDGVGVVSFDPVSVARGMHIWPPLIEETVVDGVRLNPDKDGVLRVKSGARTFDFHFTSPNIISAERLRFRYRLEGLDDKWFEAGKQRVAHFNRLRPGAYQFNVEASGSEGQWQQAVAPLQLEVLPRLYERVSVRIAGALLLIGTVAGIVWMIERSRSLRRLERLKMQRAMDHERQRIAADIHDELGAGLTEISLLGDGLRRDTQQAPALEGVAREISTRARTLTRSMDEVVWAINPSNDTLESFLTYLNRFAQEYLNKAGVRCRWDVPLELPELSLSSEARHHLYLASKEAVHNIVKHAEASEVWIRLTLYEHGFTLEIEDNGKGFDLSAPRARGNGLANMSRRLAGLSGQCQIHSVPGKGTRVRFVVASLPPVGAPL